MAVYIYTSTPSQLISEFKKKIRERQIQTWLEKDGHFTHDTDQWRYAAWLKFTPGNGSVIINIVKNSGTPVTTTVYGIYHGRIIESFLCHFDDAMSSGEATPMPAAGDVVK